MCRRVVSGWIGVKASASAWGARGCSGARDDVRAVPSALCERFVRDRSGNVAMIFALMSMGMFLIVGTAIDIGRWLHARLLTSHRARSMTESS